MRMETVTCSRADRLVNMRLWTGKVTTEDTVQIPDMGIRSWRYVLEFNLEFWGFDFGWFGQWRSEYCPEWMTDHATGFGVSTHPLWRWGFDHFWYDGPHCSFNLGRLQIWWSKPDCKRCLGEVLLKFLPVFFNVIRPTSRISKEILLRLI